MKRSSKSASKYAAAAPERTVVRLRDRRLNFGDKWDYAPAPEDNKGFPIAPRH